MKTNIGRFAWLAVGLLVPRPAVAQLGSALDRWVNFPVAPVPFGVGERMEYKITYGIFGGVGEGALEIAKIDTLRGSPSYHIDLKLKGGVPLARVNDHMQSWLDVSHLHSHRFDQNIDEVKYERHRIIDFLPGLGVWQQTDVLKDSAQTEGSLATDSPLDDISFLYYVRTLPLEVGQTYTLNRYYKNDGNPVVVKVLRKETIQVPAGKFNTIVVRPVIKTRGLFSEGGEAEVYFSDDARRMVVHMKTKLSIGTLKLHLKSYTPGTRLVPAPTLPGSTGK
jgi:hypothetical protein